MQICIFKEIYDRWIKRQIYIFKEQIFRLVERQIHELERQNSDKLIDKQIDRWIEMQNSDGWIHAQIDEQIDKQIDKLTNRALIDRQMETKQTGEFFVEKQMERGQNRMNRYRLFLLQTVVQACQRTS